MRRGRPRHDDVLTPREWEVLALLREGLTNDQIAERLGVSYDTAKFHVSEIMGKLGVESRYEAAQWAGKPKVAFGLTGLLGWMKASPARKLAAVAIGIALLGLVLLALGVVVMDSRGEEDTALVELTPSATPAEPMPTATAQPGEDDMSWLQPAFTPVDRGQPLAMPGGYLLDVETLEVWYVGSGGLWSPGGTALTFGFCCVGREGLIIQEIPSGAVTEVPIAGDIGGVTWSPDSTQLAFILITPDVTATDGERAVHIVNRDGTGHREVLVTTTAGAGWVDEVRWVSETTIVMVQRSGSDPLRPVMTYSHVNVSTGEVNELEAGQGGADDPLVLLSAHSSDGSHVAYVTDGLYVWDRADGITRLIDESGASPAWSPDGTYLLYAEIEDDPIRLPIWSLYNLRAGETIELSDVGLWAQWLPDGRLLHTGWWCDYDPATPGGIGGVQDVTLQTTDGRDVRRLSNTPDIFETGVSASPLGNLVAFVPSGPIRSLEMADLQSGVVQTVVRGPDDNLEPINVGSWSPDGRYLQFGYGFGKGLCN